MTLAARRPGIRLGDDQRLAWLRLIRSENIGPVGIMAQTPLDFACGNVYRWRHETRHASRLSPLSNSMPSWAGGSQTISVRPIRLRQDMKHVEAVLKLLEPGIDTRQHRHQATL